MLAQSGTTRETAPKVAPKKSDVGHVSLAVHQRGKLRRQPLALGARLDARHSLDKLLSAFSEAAIHLRVGPAGLLADLPVAVALSQQGEGSRLLRFESVECFRA
jgi:hypothetical protein